MWTISFIHSFIQKQKKNEKETETNILNNKLIDAFG